MTYRCQKCLKQITTFAYFIIIKYRKLYKKMNINVMYNTIKYQIFRNIVRVHTLFSKLTAIGALNKIMARRELKIFMIILLHYIKHEKKPLSLTLPLLQLSNNN